MSVAEPERVPYVGRHVRSREAPRFVTGHGHYVDDLRQPGMLHSAILRSWLPHGRIVRVDASAALKLPGVVAVITPDDVRQMTHPFAPGRYAAGPAQARARIRDGGRQGAVRGRAGSGGSGP